MSGDVETTLARIDERTGWIVKTLKEQQKCDEDHENRIRALEDNRSTKKGRDGVLAAIIALGVSVLVTLLGLFTGSKF